MVVGNNHGTVRQVSFGGPRTLDLNGKQYFGSVVEQRDGRTFVDGKEVSEEVGIVAELIVTVQGNVENLEAKACGKVSVTGDAGQVKSSAGDIAVGGNVRGNVETSAGNIKCGHVGGSVKTSAGNIKYTKTDEKDKPGFFERLFGGK